MTLMENFRLGLGVTGLGMGLVFLTLIVVMLVIWLLDRVFRPKAEELQRAAASVATAAPVAVATSPGVRGGALQPAADARNVAAAIAVAISLERAKATARFQEPVYDQELFPNVVTVITIDPGPGTWRGYGRVKAMQ